MAGVIGDCQYYSSWGDRIWRTTYTVGQTDCTLCKLSGSWPCATQCRPLHLLPHPQLTPTWPPGCRLTQPSTGRALQAPRRRQEWGPLSPGYIWRRRAERGKGCRGRVSASGVFPKDFLEERAPRSHGSKQRAETLCILSQRGHGDQGVSGEEDVGLLLEELWEVGAGEAGGANGGVGEGSSPWLFPGPALAGSGWVPVSLSSWPAPASARCIYPHAFSSAVRQTGRWIPRALTVPGPDKVRVPEPGAPTVWSGQ